MIKPLWTEWVGLESAGKGRHNVYVIELSKDVLREHKFVKRNPDYIAGKPCVYVGMTGLDPAVRFEKHRAGIKSNVYAQRYGVRLLPALYERYNPMLFEEAKTKEVKLANELRDAGYAVWQA